MKNEYGILNLCVTAQEKTIMTLTSSPHELWGQPQKQQLNFPPILKILPPWPLVDWEVKREGQPEQKSFQPLSAKKLRKRLLWLDGERKNRITVTVCVTAICDGQMIVGASDRMLTAGDVQFEPLQPKIYPLTTSIAIMIAGDSALQSDIIYKVRADVNRRIEAEPKNWWNVQDVADLYVNYYNEFKLRRAESSILLPLGLNYKTFISQQKQMDSQLVSQLASEMVNFEAPKVQAICTGVDITGPHIYIINNSTSQCCDAIGFAAIGVGYWHANSQFMFARHTRSNPFPETLLLTYSAKKRAEVAPGVGEGTDMFTIGTELGSFFAIPQDIIKSLEKMYKRAQQRTRKADRRANEEVNQYVQALIASATTKEQAKIPEVEGGNPPSDDKELPKIAEKETPTA